MKTLLLFLVSMIWIPGLVSAQETKQSKNTVIVNYGTVIFADQLSLAYERSLFRSQNKFFETKIKASFGKYLSNNYDYDEDAEVTSSHYGVSAVQLIWLWKIGLELNTGVSSIAFSTPATSTIERKSGFYLGSAIRYDSSLLSFRAGLNNIELLTIGLGINF